MKRNAVRGGVIGLALGAIALTGSAWASAEPPPAASTSAVAGTPLALLPAKPMLADHDEHSDGTAWKAGALLIVAAAGAWAWKRRGETLPAAKTPGIHIVRRTAIGIRSELLLVEVDGQRLLLGVTPTSVQNLYLPPRDEEAVEPVAAGEPVATAQQPEPSIFAPPSRPAQLVLSGEDPIDAPDSVEAARRFRRSTSTPVAEPAKPTRRKTRRRVEEAGVEEQARGLYAIGERT